MKRGTRILAAAIFALALWGCRGPVAFVAVREARFRSELATKDRLQLPLTAEERRRLMEFLRAGGDTDRIGGEIVDPQAEERFSPLLDRLSDQRYLALEDITEHDTYDPWFCKERIRQVVDAREESPPAIDPVAATDGQYWWVFYHHKKQLKWLLVVKTIPKRPSE